MPAVLPNSKEWVLVRVCAPQKNSLPELLFVLPSVKYIAPSLPYTELTVGRMPSSKLVRDEIPATPVSGMVISAKYDRRGVA